MEDREIVNLYWERNSNAIKETASKYGGYCKSIAKNILGKPYDFKYYTVTNTDTNEILSVAVDARV